MLPSLSLSPFTCVSFFLSLFTCVILSILTLSPLLEVISLSHELAATPNQTKPHLTMEQGLKNYNWARLPRPSTLYTPLAPSPSLCQLYAPCDHRMLWQSHTQMSLHCAYVTWCTKKSRIEKNKNLFHNYYYNRNRCRCCRL